MQPVNEVHIGARPIGDGHPTYVIAELSANHGQDLSRAVELVEVAAACGADAVKLQTFTPDSMTLESERPEFRVAGGTLWDGRSLHDLYAEAMTPWEWHGELQRVAHEAGIELLSTPFDRAAVDFLDELEVPAFKFASFELVDLDLIRYAASKGRPLIMSTGMATLEEVDAAVHAAGEGGADKLVLLRCNSSYPAPAAEMDLRTIADMRERWALPVGLSDHTLSDTAAVLGVALGACVLEKHVTVRRADGGPDAGFSLEPDELRALIASVREAEAALGGVRYGPSPSEEKSTFFRRSLLVVRDVAAGTALTADDVRALRPAHGMAPRHLTEVIGRVAARDLQRGEGLQPDMLE
jgi:N-acetylneuraminate synthase